MKLKELRESMGISQKELAKSINVHASNLSSIESGKRRLSNKTVYKLAIVFNLDFYKLLNYLK